MLTKKLYPVVWIVVIVGSFAFGALSTNTIFASFNPAPRAPRGELPESNAAPAPLNVIGGLPREPQALLRGGLAQAYGERERSQAIAVDALRPALHSEDRIEQALSKHESSEATISAPSEYPLNVRGGLAENRSVDIEVSHAPKSVYALHSDGWTDLYLDRFAATDLPYQGNPDHPSKLRGGPLGD